MSELDGYFGELDLMARIAGMVLIERWEDWDGRPFTHESTRHVSVRQSPVHRKMFVLRLSAMTQRRLFAAALSVAALTAAPMAVVTVVSPAVGSACAPGETAAATTCAPFCLPGLVWDYQHTGLCLPATPPPPPAPAPFNATP